MFAVNPGMDKTAPWTLMNANPRSVHALMGEHVKMQLEDLVVYVHRTGKAINALMMLMNAHYITRVKILEVA